MSRTRHAPFVLAASILAVIAVLFGACTTSEGERCNPSLSHDECASNLACTVPTNCGYALCCPKDAPERAPACAPCAGDAGPTDAADGD